jgi:hypothetical protein
MQLSLIDFTHSIISTLMNASGAKKATENQETIYSKNEWGRRGKASNTGRTCGGFWRGGKIHITAAQVRKGYENSYTMFN